MKYDPIIRGFPHILHGSDYNPEQWHKTKEIWLEDMRLAGLARINSFSVGIFSWAALEPQEGRFEFSWLDEIMDMLEKNGMKAVLATPSGARPAWLSQKYPEVLRVNADRRRILYGERHNHCPTSPVYRAKTACINEKLAGRYGHHPALGVWHLSNEYGGECHCEMCRDAFRAWLKKRYGSLDDLNEAWWTAFWSHTYTDWGQIDPPSHIGESSIHGLALDWKRFVTEQTLDFMASEMEPIKRLTPDVPCTTNMMGLYDGLNYYRLSEKLDIASWDNYPAWRGDSGDIELGSQISFVHDLNRCLKDGRPFMMMESSPSSTNWQEVGKLRRPGQHALQSIQAVAHGSDTVQYFQFRKSRGSSEKFHGAVVDHVGTEDTRVFREVAETGEVLEKLDPIVGTVVDSDTAIIYDVENRWAIDMSQGFLKQKNYMQTIMEHYAPFWKAGVSVDVIDSTKQLAGYKLVIAPMLYMLRPGMAEKIEAFVRGGGVFVATYMTGYVDEHDLCFRGGFPGPLKGVLGIWCEEMDSLYPEERRAVKWSGAAYTARDFCEIVHLRGASAEGEYLEDFYSGTPAVTVNRFGAGDAYYIAARLDDNFNGDFYGMLIRKLDLKKALSCRLPEGCTARSRSDGKNSYVFLMNFSHEAKTIITNESARSLLTGEEVGDSIPIAPRGFDVLRVYKSRNEFVEGEKKNEGV